MVTSQIIQSPKHPLLIIAQLADANIAFLAEPSPEFSRFVAMIQ